MSYPLWVRGLKLECLQEGDPIEEVVPFVGTWIEIKKTWVDGEVITVVPFVGTWIEIPSRLAMRSGGFVVPFVGTWIEISRISQGIAGRNSRTLCGYVD